jgi:hypothetical protein
VPFDILAVRNMGPNTFEFEFTKPLLASLGTDVSANLVVNTWWDRLSETYGCCRRNAANANGVTTVTGFTATVQANRAKVTVNFPTALSQYWIYYMRWTDTMLDEANGTLYGTEAWYTLNNFGPGTAPVTVTPDSRVEAAAPFTLAKLAGGKVRLYFTLPEGAPYKVAVTGLDGRTTLTRRGRGPGEVLFGPTDFPGGVGILRIEAGNRTYARLVSR